jgi:tetratricopeptide (TPR) repeat protein
MLSRAVTLRASEAVNPHRFPGRVALIAVVVVAAGAWPLDNLSGSLGQASSDAPNIRSSAQAGTPRATFAKDIAPILFEHCTSCHRTGEIGPFSLERYADVRPRARAIARETRARRMPPWKPEPLVEASFVGERRLTEQQIALIEQWAADGAPEGNPRDTPSLPPQPAGWRLGRPDLVVTMPEPFTVAADGPDVLRNFVLPIPSHVRRFVSAIEFRPGNPRVVHHANIRVDRTRTSRALDASDPLSGYEGLVSATAEFPDGHFLGWTPGQLPPRLAPGMAWVLEPESDFVVQLHLHPGGRAETVQSAIGVFFTDEAPTRTPTMLRLGRQNVDIPAGATDYTVDDTYTLPVSVELHAVQPHAHYRAKEVLGTAVLPDGRHRTLIHIPDWDFNWQDVYRYVRPLALPAGTTVNMRYRFDNSTTNRRNPDNPPRRVTWGQNSTDEMSDLWLQVVTASPSERARLAADFGPKVMTEDAVGYEMLLRRDPRNARLHEAAASVYLWLGDTARAIDHLKSAISIRPDEAETHYNLAAAYVRERRGEDAIAAYSEALRLRPDYPEAHVNLGAVLRLSGEWAGARQHLERGVALQPTSVAAHVNLAGVLAEQGELTASISRYRTALDLDASSLEALTNLSWLLGTTAEPTVRNSLEAVRLASRADELTDHRQVRVLETLAAALAAAGEFNRATAAQNQAIERAVETHATPEALRVLRDRLTLYQNRRALVVPAPAAR